jgi:hypothetical protein
MSNGTLFEKPKAIPVGHTEAVKYFENQMKVWNN